MKINSYSLATCILNELKKKRLRDSVFGFNCEFTKEELEAIETLNIFSCDSLDGIEHLTKLKTLRLIGANLDSFSSVGSLNNIIDFSPIKELKSLENLAIWHDNNIKVLDITGLNLKTLNLISNHNLIEIKGLDQMTTLTKIHIVGSKITTIGCSLRYIINTSEVREHILDLKMFNPIFANKNVEETMISVRSKVRFGEQIHFFDEIYILSLEQMRELNSLGQNIISSVNLDFSEYAKAFEIYKYVINNTTYDYDGLKYRDQNYENMMKNKEKMDLRKMEYINSSLCTLKEKKAVCDGYVNAIIYLLSLIDIKALPVICVSQDNSLHAAIKILIDGKWIYADPEKDSSNKKIRYFNLTREELSKMYKLAPKEYLDHIDGGAYVKRFE